MVNSKLEEFENVEDWPELLSRLEKLAVAGKHDEVRAVLDECAVRNIPRELAASLGELAFRVNDPLFAVKALQKIIYPENTLMQPHTQKERVIYSAGLSSLGVIGGALALLNDINVEQEPEALFYTASAHNYDWNYGAAITYLRKFIQSDKVPPYRKLVGKVNLAAALISFSDWIGARELLNEIQLHCEKDSYDLLLGNCYELKAQLEIFQGRYDEAFNFLERASHYLQNQGGIYQLFVEKWKVICSALKYNDPKYIDQLKVLRTKAFSLRHWNTVRECDLFTAILTKDENLFKHVIMGTPSEFYRARARKLFGKNVIASGRFEFQIGPQPKKITFDPYQKNLQGEALFEKPLLLALYQALTRDFYQPQTVGQLFESVYKGEIFNPFNSPNRVLQLLRRLNSWFEEHGYEIRVEIKKSEFQLVSADGAAVIIQRGAVAAEVDGKMLELKNAFDYKSFTVSKVSEALGISKISAHRLISAGVASGKIIQNGIRRGATYRLNERSAKKKSAS